MNVEKSKNRMNFALTEEVREILIDLSKRKQISMSEIVRRAIEDYYKQEKNQIKLR